MGIKDRIFDLVFPEWKRERRRDPLRKAGPRSRRKQAKRTESEGYDSRYYVHRRR